MFSQTTGFPSSLDGNSFFRVGVNNISTTTTGTLTSNGTSVTLASTTGIVQNMLLTIDAEAVAVCNVSGLTVTFGYSSCPNVDGRGFDGTTAVAHNSTAIVKGYIDAWHHNSLVSAVNKIESVLGGGIKTDADITSAITACGGSPCTILLPAGTITMNGKISVPSNVTIRGQGRNITVLQIPTNGWPSSGAASSSTYWCTNSWTNQICVITSADNATNVWLQDFTLDLNGANQNQTAIGYDIYFPNCTDCGASRILVKNMKHSGAAFNESGPNGANNVFNQLIIHGFDSGPCAGGILFQHGLVINSYFDKICDSSVASNGATGNGSKTRTIAAYNTVINDSNSGNMFTVEGTTDAEFIGNIATGPATAGCYRIDANIVPQSIGSVRFVHNLCDSNANGSPTFGVVTAASASNTVSRITLEDNLFGNTIGNCIQVGGNSNSVAVSNILMSKDHLYSCGNAGIFVNQGSKNVNIIDESIISAVGNGIVIAATGTSNISIGLNNITLDGGVAISDGSGAANVFLNPTDEAFNMVSQLSPLLFQTMTLVNGANENISTLIGAVNSGQIYYRIAGPSGSFSVGGFANPTNQKVLYLSNQSGQTFTITHLDASSTAANRIYVPGGSSISPVLSAILIYDQALTNWVVVAWH